MKISVPWPVNPSSQIRIKEAIDLWENKNQLILCLIEPCEDPFIKKHQTFILPRNSKSIGTKIAKPFIHDMVVVSRDFSKSDYCGFGNSDCVPVGDIIEDHMDYEVLIYHRTDILKWEHRFKNNIGKPVDQNTIDYIWTLRQQGNDDRKIARHLNISGVKLPDGEKEWTYLVIRNILEDQGSVFFWGQDLYLFRKDIVDKVINNYLKIADPILGTGGFDPRLTKWCLDNFKGARVLNKIFHLKHQSEWNCDEIEYKHNGGDIEFDEQAVYYNDLFLMSLCEKGQKGTIPKYIRYMVGKNKPELWNELVLNS